MLYFSFIYQSESAPPEPESPPPKSSLSSLSPNKLSIAISKPIEVIVSLISSSSSGGIGDILGGGINKSFLRIDTGVYTYEDCFGNSLYFSNIGSGGILTVIGAIDFISKLGTFGA